MLKLICGPSGSGKTESLIAGIRSDIQNKIPCFLLVPEQQAYISERDLPAVLPCDAGLYFEVVHFSGLAEDVFRKFGGLTQTSATDGIRTLLMWETLRNLSPFLKLYGKSAHGDSSLTALMLQAVSQLRADGIDSQALENAAEQINEHTALKDKLTDIALIDASYHAKLEECFGADPSDRLVRMAQKLREHHYFDGCRLYIDSFTSFTVPEYAVLREILRQADTVTVALCADDFSSKLPHFESTVETAKRLCKLAAETNCEVQKKRLRVNPSVKPAELHIIEKDLWNFELSSSMRTNLEAEDRGAVSMMSCVNLYEEAEAAALYICDLVQRGMNYGDIAVMVRDTEAYRGVLDAAFERQKIPYFLSERTDLSSKPLARLILSALRAISHGYLQSDIITLLKTGLCGIELRDAAMFEEYCQTWHINGKRFFDETWSMNPDGLTVERSARAEEILDAANRVRKKIIDPLRLMETEMRQSSRLESRCRALYHYLFHLDIANVLSTRAKQEISMGQRREAGETVRLYRMVVDHLATICSLLPDAELKTEEFITVLSLLFSNSDLGSVPNTNDCVVIGSASTLRVENIRVSLLLGLCEGEFPRAVTDDGILSESEKETLEAYGLNFGAREKMRSSEELFYVYRAMTKPKEKLWLSTVAKQTDGSERTPSLGFTRVGFLLQQTPSVFDSDALLRASGQISAAESESNLHTLPTPTPTTLYLSQSKISSFVLCPYRYYSTYRLKLREKKDATPSYADDGIFLHEVFEQFLSSALGEDGKLYLPDASEIEAVADRIIASYLAKICPFSLDQMDNRLLHLYARLRKLSILMLKDMIGELKASLFVPSKFEQVIGSQSKNGLPAVKLMLENGSTVLLNGKIDRVDLYRSADKIYVRVVDYKAGKHIFSLDEVRSGMDIQLVLYLFAVLAAYPNAEAAGAQYLFASSEKGQLEIRRSGFLLNDRTVQQAADSTENAYYTKKLYSQTADEIKDLQEEMQTAVKAVAERILSGEAQKTPSEKACTFCPVRSNCDKAYHR
ncbi:MAG: exodeoxyribonuclease V subunit gamma [Clostridia bacterium]|nr:exodeoxyribonuclease V subunit gamma [Clostridia bacterium]